MAWFESRSTAMLGFFQRRSTGSKKLCSRLDPSLASSAARLLGHVSERSLPGMYQNIQPSWLHALSAEAFGTGSGLLDVPRILCTRDVSACSFALRREAKFASLFGNGTPRRCRSWSAFPWMIWHNVQGREEIITTEDEQPIFTEARGRLADACTMSGVK